MTVGYQDNERMKLVQLVRRRLIKKENIKVGGRLMGENDILRF